jgi:hypothetical protein
MITAGSRIIGGSYGKSIERQMSTRFYDNPEYEYKPAKPAAERVKAEKDLQRDKPKQKNGDVKDGTAE